MINSISALIDYYAKTKQFDRDKVTAALEAGFVESFRHMVPSAYFTYQPRAEITPETGIVRIFATLTVVSDDNKSDEVRLGKNHIALSTALKKFQDAKVGSILEFDVTPKGLGKIGYEEAKFYMIKRLLYPGSERTDPFIWKNDNYLTEMGFAMSNEEELDYKKQFMYFIDLHELSLQNAIIMIDVALEHAQSSRWEWLKIIHGFHGGTAIRDHIWNSVDDNRWISIIGEKPVRNLLGFLNKYNFRPAHKGEEVVEIENFVFRSGSTSLPILKIAKPHSL